MSARERLEAVQQRADAATDGTWEAHGLSARVSAPNVRTRRPVALQEGIAYRVATVADAEFIAAARQDVPALVAALRAVLDLHVREEPDAISLDPWCGGCGDTYPCETVRAIEQHLGGPR